MTDGQACINIDGRERWKRIKLGIIALFIGVLASFLLIHFDAPRVSRAFLFLIFFLSALGFLQAKKKICVVLAAQGKKHTLLEAEKIEDAYTSFRVQKGAQKILFQSVVIAALITGVLIALF